MELFLHLGAHRTGSTAFQRILARNANALAAQGTAIWGPRELREMPHFYLPEKGGFAPGAEAAFAADLAAVTAPRLVISEENIIGTMRHNLVRRAFYPAMPARLAAYGGLIGITPTRIGLGIREYASYWASAYTYLLPRHRLPEFAEIKAALLGLRRGWLDLVHELRALFPKAEIRVWPLEAVGGQMRDLVAGFVGQPGADLQDVGRRVNASRGAEVVPLIHAIRAEQPRITPEALQEKLQSMPRPSTPPAPLFSDDEVLDLAMRYADEMSTLEAGFEGVQLVTQPGRAA